LALDNRPISIQGFQSTTAADEAARQRPIVEADEAVVATQSLPRNDLSVNIKYQ